MTDKHKALFKANRLKFWATRAAVSTAVMLCLLKAAGAVATGSVAILSSLVDSLADIVASVVTLLAVRVSATPPDRTHRFGHGKAEALSALTQSALIAGSAVFVIVEAIQRLVMPKAVEDGVAGPLIMGIAIILTVILVLFQRYVERETGSPAISADRLHYESDLFTGCVVLASLFLGSFFDLYWIDPVVALAIAAYLLSGAYRISSQSVHTLMDHELPTPARQRIKTIVSDHPAVDGLHDLRTREAAGTCFIEFHIELDGEMRLHDAHQVTDTIEMSLMNAFPEAEVIIHQEPSGVEDQRLDDRIERPADIHAANG